MDSIVEYDVVRVAEKIPPIFFMLYVLTLIAGTHLTEEKHMQKTVTFRHMDASDALKAHALERASRMNRYFHDGSEAHIVLSLERYLHKAEVNMMAHGMVMCGKETSSDMYNSIDRAMDKIEKQVKRYREKMVNFRPKDAEKLKMNFKLLEENNRDTTSHLPPTVIETKEFQARHMTVDEAVMQMDLLHNDVLVFLNPKTDHLNVLYRKKDNQYGLIETSSDH